MAQEKTGNNVMRPKAVWIISGLILLAQFNVLLTLAYLAVGSGPGEDMAYSYVVERPMTWNKAYVILIPTLWIASAIALFRLMPISVYLFILCATLVVAQEINVMVRLDEYRSIGELGLGYVAPLGNLLKVLAAVGMTLYVLRLQQRGLLR